MTLKRGPFRLQCDGTNCDEFVDLETEDFEEAKELADDSGFATYRGPEGFKHFCAGCDPL